VNDRLWPKVDIRELSTGQRLLLSNRTVQKEPLRALNTAGAAHHFAENRDLHRCFSIRARHDAMGGILSAIPGYEIVPA
jgi:hypothetical protein